MRLLVNPPHVPLPAFLAFTLAAGAALAAENPVRTEAAREPDTARALARRHPDAGPRQFRVDMHYTKGSEHRRIRRWVDGPRSRMEATVGGRTMALIDLGDEKGRSVGGP